MLYNAISNYIHNELKITKGDIVEIIKANVHQAVVAFMETTKDSHWMKELMQKAIYDGVRSEARTLLQYGTTITVTVDKK